MMQLLTRDVTFAENCIIELAQKSARERLAEAILVLKETFGFEENTAVIDVSLTREDIANLVGTSTESIIRLISEFKKHKLIEVNGIVFCRNVFRSLDYDFPDIGSAAFTHEFFQFLPVICGFSYFDVP